ncbi:MAG: (2Fe-2S)-binding protein [Pseudomonadota bacterium]
MYICICQAITDRQIRSAAAAGVDSVDQLRDTLGVASCCGSCEGAAAEVLAEHRCEVAQREPKGIRRPVVYRPDTAAV